MFILSNVIVPCIALDLYQVREDVKYYFADFVRKGGEGGTPHICNLFFGPKSGVFEQKNNS